MGPGGLIVQGVCRVTAALVNQRRCTGLLLGSWHPREPHPVGISTVRRLIAAEMKELEGVTLSTTLKELLVPQSPEVHLPSLKIGITMKYSLTARSSSLLQQGAAAFITGNSQKVWRTQSPLPNLPSTNP